MPNTKRLDELIDAATQLRTRLIWLIGMPGSGKTNLLMTTAGRQPNCVYVNLNAALSGLLVRDVSDQQPFKVGQHLSAILSPRSTGAWLVDNIEILFSRRLKVPVVDRLNSLAQRVTLVIAWPGSVEDGRLIYGARNHPDFAIYPVDSPLVLDMNHTNNQGQ